LLRWRVSKRSGWVVLVFGPIRENTLDSSWSVTTRPVRVLPGALCQAAAGWSITRRLRRSDSLSMSRYKGRPSFTSLTRDFPHTVQKHHGPARAGSEARRRPMNYEKEITKLNANVVGTQIVVVHVLGRLIWEHPEIAAAIRHGFDNAANQAE